MFNTLSANLIIPVTKAICFAEKVATLFPNVEIFCALSFFIKLPRRRRRRGNLNTTDIPYIIDYCLLFFRRLFIIVGILQHNVQIVIRETDN